MSAGFVYFIRLGKYVKVGYSTNPERRCARLFTSQTRYSKPWDCPMGRGTRTLLGYVPGRRHDERFAHMALDDFAVGCEFFLAEPLLLDYAVRCMDSGRILRGSVTRPEGPAECVGQVEPDPEADAKLRATLANWDFLTPRGAA